MGLSRDNVQGFIDGYTKAGGLNLHVDISDWMLNHPIYPQAKNDHDLILNDLISYRIEVPRKI